MKILKSGVEFDTTEFYSNISTTSTVDLIKELTVAEENYNKILLELNKRFPDLEKNNKQLIIKRNKNDRK